ncbi:MAG: T9SS type A sorting domain-containing protein [Bacteroidia bacterium]|nr:T9SS type A sorting domain-containing protein [Bacteroidia bacterium]
MIIGAVNANADEVYQRSFYANESSAHLSAQTQGILNSLFAKYNVYSIDANAIDAFLKKDGSLSVTDLKLGNEYVFHLYLESYDLKGEGYTMTESTPQGEIIHTGESIYTYRGYNNNNPSNLVYLTITSNYISGFIQQEGQSYFIEPVSRPDADASDQMYVVYNTKDVKNGPDMTCGVTEALEAMEKVAANTQSQAPMACVLTEIAIVATADFVTKYGGATACQTQVISQMNTVSGLYAQAAVDIKYKLVKFYASTSNQVVSDSETDIANCLDAFRTWANGGAIGVTYDVATLWVGRNLFLNGGAIGGYAYGGSGVSSATICKTNRYNCVEDKNSTSLNGVLQAHELGHSWGCAHQSSSTTNIMNPIVNANSNVWTPTCISTISGAKTNATCTSSCSVIGIDEANTENIFVLHPNPAANNLTITLAKQTDVEIAIYSLTGELIYSEKFKFTSNTLGVDVSAFSNGLYLLRARSGSEISSQKFMVEK